MDFEDVRSRYDRIAIAGGPKSGKTTLTAGMARLVVHGDDFQNIHWNLQPQALIDAVADEPRFVIEGINVARALRKGLEVDAVVWLDLQPATLTPRQAGLAKAVRTVFTGWQAERPGVPVFPL